MVLDADDHDTWSVGSFFTNPVLDPAAAATPPGRRPALPAPDGRVKTSAAWLIERAGVRRGHSLGTGPPSPPSTPSRSPTAAERPRPTSSPWPRDVRDRVRDAFGIVLEPEPTLVGVALTVDVLVRRSAPSGPSTRFGCTPALERLDTMADVVRPVGPVDIAVIAFDEPKFDGSVAAAIADLVAGGLVRILDIVLVYKDDER